MDSEFQAPLTLDGAKAGRREWLALAVVALPCMLYSMDLTVLDLALPTLSRVLEPSSSELLWIVDIYGFLLAGSLVTMGMLGDRFGRRRLLLLGAIAFQAASVLAAFSTTARMLIVARGLLGIAGATFAPSTLSLIRNMFEDPRERTFAVGMWATSFSVGAAIGPLAGGLLLQRFWWGSAFLIGAPILVLVLLLGPALLPEFRSENVSPIDWVSAVLSALGVLPIIYGIKHAALGGSALLSAVCVLGGLVTGVVFFRRQRELATPLVDVGLFRTQAFSISITTNAFTLFVTFGIFLFIAQYLQQVQGLSPLSAGLCTLPPACGFIAGSVLAPQLVKHFSPAHVMAASLLLAATGLLVLARLEARSPLAWVIAGSTLLGLGSSPAVTLATDLVVGAAPPERAGAASALSETGGEFGGALGIAILGTVGGAVYRFRMHENDDLPLSVADTARETLGGALTAAKLLPPVSAHSLIDRARGAFVEGMHVATLIAAAVVIALATLVFTRLGRKQREVHAEDATTG